MFILKCVCLSTFYVNLRLGLYLLGFFCLFYHLSLFVCAKRININTLKEILTTLGIVNDAYRAFKRKKTESRKN